MVETGTYKELLATSSSFRCLLENIHQQEELVECSGDIVERRQTRCVTFSETENDEILSSSTNLEKKKEGSVNWRVYISYMRAGAGVILTILLITLAFGGRETTSIFYNWWLAKWSDDNSYRHRHWNNCTKANNEIANRIRSMNDTEWNNYQKRRFHIYSGLFI